MGFSRQKNTGVVCNALLPVIFPTQGLNPSLLQSPALEGRFFTTSATWETQAATAPAKSLQSCPTLCYPRDGSPQAPPSLGFPRQEHWSGLPCPSPMHESEKWKWSRSVMSDSSRPHGLQPTRLSRPWDFPAKSTGVGCHCLLWEAQTGLSSIQIGSLSLFTLANIQAHIKPLWRLSLLTYVRLLYHPMDNTFLCPWNFPGNNTGVGCHFLLQGIFLVQGSNLHFLQVHMANFIASGFWNPITMKGSWELNYVMRELCFYFCCILVTEKRIIRRQDGIRQTS